MSLPTQIAAYDDCVRVLDRAMQSNLRVAFHTYEESRVFQLRTNMARSLLRKDSCRLYSEDDPRWNRSTYDKLVIRNPREDTEGLWWIYIETPESNIVAIEEVPAEHHAETRKLEAPASALEIE